MIKLDIPNLDKIAESYCFQLKQKKRRSCNSLCKYFIENIEYYILCPLSDMNKASEKFKNHFIHEINNCENARQDFINSKIKEIEIIRINAKH